MAARQGQGKGKKGRKTGRNLKKCQRYAERHGVSGKRRAHARRSSLPALILPMAGGAMELRAYDPLAACFGRAKKEDNTMAREYDRRRRSYDYSIQRKK